MECSHIRKVDTKEKAKALREMFPNGMQPLRELETKAKGDAFREMFPNWMQPFTGVRDQGEG